MLGRDLWLNPGGTCWEETSGLTVEGHVGQRPLAEPWRDMLGRDLWLNPGGTCWEETSALTLEGHVVQRPLA